MSPVDLEHAKEVLRHEATAILGLIERIDAAHFGRACELILASPGHLVVSGMGKAFLVGTKISATLASTGTPSISLHAAEALHGDLGRVREQDVALVISNSGRTRECVELLPAFKKLGVPVIAMTGDASSPLAEAADVLLDLGNLEEACPLRLAPSTTTTAMLALGDALALTILNARDFGPDEFAQFHPAGSLGRKLMRVEDVMRKGDRAPTIRPDENVGEALTRITKARAGAVAVVDPDGKLIGIFTDGNLRRHLLEGRGLDEPLAQAMHKDPIRIEVGKLASEAQHILQSKQIDELPVVDAAGHAVGVVDVQDILGTVA